MKINDSNIILILPGISDIEMVKLNHVNLVTDLTDDLSSFRE